MVGKDIIFTFVTILYFTGITFAGSNQDSIELLQKTYEIDDATSTTELTVYADALNASFAKCKDEYLALRLQYRVGILNFKAQRYEKSLQSFSQVISSPVCSDVLRINAYNMMGQIFRIRGDMESSLDAFEKLLKTIESSDVGHKQKICEQLAISALIGRAEIYSSMKRTKEAVSTYQKLISKIENSSVTNDYVGYIPVAKDKMLNLLLKDGNIADYVKLVDEMLVDHGDYNRISIIEFKKTCIEFLCSVKANESFSGGSFQAPVELVRYLRRHGVRDNAIISEMQILCEKYEKDEGSILLYYHYAWALDAIGKREQAVEVLFEKVCSNVLGEAKERKAKSLSEELLRYATIQCVIMMGEQKAYEEAHLLVGDLLNDDEDQSHISKLAHSVAEGINVLEDKVEGNAIKK